MPKDMTDDSRIEVMPGKPVELPGGDFIANAVMMREGLDLRLTSPDGRTLAVENYFAQDPPPDMVATDGARLTPHLVGAFLTPGHIGQYAASGQIAHDASPSGKVTVVVGEAHIIRADGTQVPATINTPLYQGDVVETAKTGAVNIIFADNTAFAVSENARLAIDKFTYDAAHQDGASFFSMLRGAFVYTSGLIGKTDPGDVSIETPVGTIGIRGTAVVGVIAGILSSMGVWEGIILLDRPGDPNDVLMNHRFEMFSLTGLSQPGESLGLVNPKDFMNEHPILFQTVDAPWFGALINIYNQLYHPGEPPGIPNLPMPHINEGGMLGPKEGDQGGSQAMGLLPGQELIGGDYVPIFGVMPLSPFAQPGSGSSGGDTIAATALVLNNTFSITDSDIEATAGPEFVIRSSVPSVQIDGGAGYDILRVGTPTTPHIDVDTTIPYTWQIQNIEKIVLGESSETLFGNHALLDIAGVFAMTDSDHILEIEADFPDPLIDSFVDVVFGAGAGFFSAADLDPDPNTAQYQGTFAGQTVTLVIHTGDVAAGQTPIVIGAIP